MLVLDGKSTAQAIRQLLAGTVDDLMTKTGKRPGLAVILVGDDPASQTYVRNKEKACKEVGIYSETFKPNANITQEDLLHLISSLNKRDDIHGILLQLPLPKHLNSQACLDHISPLKDVDGFHPVSMGKLALGLPGPRPCTPAGVMALLRHYKLSPAGKKAVVLGRSNIVGKPLALMLAERGPDANATVTLCHSGTENLKEICKEADFLFAAIGKPKFVTADMVKPGAVVIDVGINATENGLCGDCDYENLTSIVSAITPVPGGIGPMTIAMLMYNTVEAFAKHCHVKPGKVVVNSGSE